MSDAVEEDERRGRTDKGRERAEQLLDAGLAAALNRPAEAILPSRAETLRASGATPGALGPASSGSYRNLFGASERFHHRLVRERLLGDYPVVPETIEDLARAVAALERGEAVNLPDVLARIARRNLETNLEETDLDRARLLCFVAGLAPGGEDTAAALRDDFRAFTAEFAAMYEHVLEAWGVRLRAPFDTGSLALLLAALADGMTLRHLADPGSVDLDLYQHAFVGLLLLLVARPGDDRSLPQLIEDVFPRPRTDD